jgi:hypothetical protein
MQPRLPALLMVLLGAISCSESSSSPPREQASQGGAPIPGCESHASFGCDQGNVYWFDSCGERESVKAHCAPSEECIADACVDGPPDPDESFATHAVSLLGPVTFEDEDLAPWLVADAEQTFAEWATGLASRSNSYGSSVSSSQWATIVEYPYQGADATLSSKGLQLTMVEGVGNLDHIPMNMDVMIAEDPTNIDVYLTFNVKFVASEGWNNTVKATAWKYNGMFAGLNPTDMAHPTTLYFDYTQSKNKMMGKGVDGANLERFVTYPSGGWTNESYVVQTLTDPATGDTHFVTANDEPVVNLTMRIFLGDVGVANGFMEYFLNGKFSHRIDTHEGNPIMLREVPIAVDALNLSYHWGGPPDMAPVGGDASIVYDDITMFKYEDSFAEAYLNAKSPPDRQLLLPSWSTSGGHKLEYVAPTP